MIYVGKICSIIGLAALVFTGINYINNTESFSALGVDVAVSKGDPLPVIISVIVLLVGIIITKLSKKNSRRRFR